MVAAPRDYKHSLLRRHLVVLRAALAARGPFDGVEGHVLYPAGLIAWLVARLRRAPVLLYAHGADVLEAARRNRIHAALARFVARHADAVVANSRSIAEAVAMLGAKAEVVPPGVDLEVFAPGDRGAARASLGLDRDALLALYVGGLIERKGPDVFADAMAQVDGWIGLVVGGGPLAARVTAAGTVRVHAAVPPSEVATWMTAADVVVVPSRSEPLGLAAVEALACGRPVVASAVGGLQDVVRDGETGILVPPGDPSALAAAIKRLSDEKLRIRFGDAAPDSVAAHGMESVTDAMARVWLKLGVEL